eukprot:gene48235-63140_t
MYSYDGSFGSDYSISGGVTGQFDVLLGIGVEEEAPQNSLHSTIGTEHGRQQSVSTARESSTSYEYSISFDYSFSTSADPFTAGHASDIIVGGGVDLI